MRTRAGGVPRAVSRTPLISTPHGRQRLRQHTTRRLPPRPVLSDPISAFEYCYITTIRGECVANVAIGNRGYLMSENTSPQKLYIRIGWTRRGSRATLGYLRILNIYMTLLSALKTAHKRQNDGRTKARGSASGPWTRR